MATNALDTCTRHKEGDQKYQPEVYEKQWNIPDWDRIQRSEDTLTGQTFEFDTGKTTRVQTKWLVGLKVCHESGTQFRVYWKLIDAKGFTEDKVPAIVNCTLLRKDSNIQWTDTQQEAVSVGQMVDVPKILQYQANWTQWMNSNGELVFKLKLTIMEPELPALDSKMELFHKSSVAQLCVNFGNLLGDEATADIKIITSDGNEWLAHKAILKAQCTVFESMFRSQLTENKTGIVDVKDVSSKTMSILLHFFYTGNLLPSWKDDDTVVEFAYAVGKYQLENILKLLDDVLGSRDENDATYTDLKLLDLAQNLGLKTAEKELLERIKKTTIKVNSAMELFALYGIKKRSEVKTIDSKF